MPAIPAPTTAASTLRSSRSSGKVGKVVTVRHIDLGYLGSSDGTLNFSLIGLGTSSVDRNWMNYTSLIYHSGGFRNETASIRSVKQASAKPEQAVPEEAADQKKLAILRSGRVRWTHTTTRR